MNKERDALTVEIATHKFLRPHRNDSGYVMERDGSDYRGRCPAGLPIPPHRLWIGYGATPDEHIESGRRHVGTMMAAVRETGFDPFKPGAAALDFGCGAGRMLRQFLEHAGACELWGCDLSGDHVVWAKQYLSPPFRFITNTTFPHLPFADRKFDFIYCGSVFTHIDDLADAWLCELGRILALGGRLFVSIHDENTVGLLDSKQHKLANQVRADTLYQANKDRFDLLVIDRGTWSQVFYDAQAFKRTAELLGFKVLKVQPCAYGYQTGVVMTVS